MANYPEIFKGMTDHDVNNADIQELDRIMPELLSKTLSHPFIHLIHSRNEPTYDRDIKYLINDLKQSNLAWEEIECGFKEHNDIGKIFPTHAGRIINSIAEK